jgi:hypothetical protein
VVGLCYDFKFAGMRNVIHTLLGENSTGLVENSRRSLKGWTKQI